jgi:hypothetical protein
VKTAAINGRSSGRPVSTMEARMSASYGSVSGNPSTFDPTVGEVLAHQSVSTSQTARLLPLLI